MLAIVVHGLAMAAHQPALAGSIPPDILASLCITSGEQPGDLPDPHSGDAGGRQGLFCAICQNQLAGGYAPQSPALAGPVWTFRIDGGLPPAPPPPLSLPTELNPRGPPPVV